MFFDEQLTEAGVIGTLGVLVVRLANTEDSPEVENVISPAPQFGGKQCEEESNQTRICNGNVSCPGTYTKKSHMDLLVYKKVCLEVKIEHQKLRAAG